MADYRELREEWELVISDSVTNGTRIFIDEPGGTASLPVLGDPFSVEYPGCTMVGMSKEKYHVIDGETGCAADGFKYVASYSTSDTAPFRPVRDTDIDQINFTAGCEVWSVESPKFWYWQPDAGAVATTGEVDQRLFKNTVRGTVSKTVTYPVDDFRFGQWLNDVIHPKLGCINNNAWLDVEGAPGDILFKKGTVLFSSYSGKQFLDKKGDKQWEITLNFSYRILNIQDPGGVLEANVENSWHYLLRKDKYSVGERDWQKPQRLEIAVLTEASYDKNYLYSRVSFDGIL